MSKYILYLFAVIIVGSSAEESIASASELKPNFFSAIGSKRLQPNSDYNVKIFVEPTATSSLTFALYLKTYELFDSKYNENATISNNSTEDYNEIADDIWIPIVGTTLFTSPTVVIAPGNTGTLTLAIGDLEDSRFNLTLIVTDENDRKFEDFNLVTNERNTKKQSLLIQSDKVIYKPGETVKFRVILLNQFLRPVNNETLDITVCDPQQNIIKNWKNIEIQRGVFSSELKLSSEPIQGEWKLSVTCNSEIKEHEFTVEEYVLPKFSVKILPPPFFTFDTPKFVVEVRAAYTFGKKMVGDCEIQISEITDYYRGRYYQPKRATKKSGMDGSAFFEFDIQSEIEGGHKLDREKSYELRATVTEKLTGRNMNATAVQIRAYKFAHRIEAVHTVGKFKPGFPFTFNFKILTHDGRPLEDKNLSAVQFRHGFACDTEDEFKYSDLPPKGLVSFTIARMPTNEHMRFPPVVVTYKGHAVEFPPPARHTSPSKTYMELNLESGSTLIPANSRIQINLVVNKPIKTLTAILFGRGQILSVQTLTFDPTSKPKSHYFYFDVPSLAGPNAKIVVYTIDDLGQLDAEPLDFTVTDYLDNFLNLTLSKEVAEPGENLTLTMVTSPGSAVLLRGVDQSVLLLKTDKDITSMVIEDEFKEFLPKYDSYRLRGGSNTFQIFEETGVIIFTNSNLEREKPKQRSGHRHRKLTRKKVHNKNMMMVDEMVEYDMDSDSIPDLSGSRSTPKKLKVRKDFPETWIWQEIQSNQSETILQKSVPDTLTSWIISGYSLNSETGIGVLREPLTLKTFRPFFLTLNKPYSIVKGEIFGLQILVHNYLDSNVTASVTLKNPDGAFEYYKEVDKNLQFLTQEVNVGSNEVNAITIVIRPIKFGPLKLEVSVMCDDAGDAVSEILIVKPPGQKQERNKAVLLDLRKKSEVTEILSAEFPPRRVEGADTVKVSIISDLLGSTVSNLDKLLKMPYGCGEQNMVTFVPDIVILEYLTAIGKLTTEIKVKATGFLEVGYQRELTYRHDDGSFSAFGKSDPHGSTWLTAFVVRSFVAAQPHITVDPGVIQSSLKFLASKQQADGSFIDLGRLLNSAMASGATDTYSLSAYVMLAFIESRYGAQNFESDVDYPGVINKGLAYLTKDSPDKLAAYQLTLATFGLQAVNHTLKESFHAQLEKLATKDDSFTYWEPPKDSNVSKASWEPSTKPLAVEMTAYSLIMYLRDSQLEKALSSGKWLLGQRNAEGGFISTQDTVVGLTALGAFALATQSSQIEMSVKAGQETFQVNADNAMVLQEVNLPCDTRSVTFKANGEGTALAQLTWTYYVEDKPESPVFIIEVETGVTEVKGPMILRVCMTYESADGKKAESNMVVCEINLPTGYSFDRDELSPMERVTGVKRFDLEEGSTRLNIYLDYLDSTKMCVQAPAVRIFKVGETAKAYVSVYDYYDTTRYARAFYAPPTIPANQITCMAEEDNCV